MRSLHRLRAAPDSCDLRFCFQRANAKLEPLIVASLKSREGFRPAYHMDRKNWITILLDGSVDGEEIYTFLDMSFGNVGPRRKKK